MAKKKEEQKKSDVPVTKQDYEKLRRQNEKLNKQLKKAKSPKGIPSAVQTLKGEAPRTDEILQNHLDDAELKQPEEYNKENKMAIEREIRRFVKKGGTDKEGKPIKGGLRKKLSERQIKRCNELLVMIGRVDKNGNPIYEWDEEILIPGFVPEGVAEV